MNTKFYAPLMLKRTYGRSELISLPLTVSRKETFSLKMILLFAMFLTWLTFPAQAQTNKITGKVIDEVNTGIPGATISEKGKKNSTMADVSGSYSITVSNGATLVITAIGFETKEIVAGNQTSINIQLTAKENSLNEVVVTALGIKREKKLLTYSTQQIKGEQLAAAKEASVLNALDGKVAGVQITTSSGAPGASSRIVIRGNSSLTGNNEALIILDGVPINNSQSSIPGGAGNGVSRLSDIDPAIIESINVLKGSAASALYGSEAARGVVIITTKGGANNTKPKFTFNSQFSFENPILPVFQDKYALGDRVNGVPTYYDGETGATKTSSVWGPLISDLEAQGKLTYNRDPLKDFFTTGKTFTNTVSVNGGSPTTGYFMSFSNLDQGGTVPTTQYRRNSFFAKFNQKMGEKFDLTFQLTYTLSNNHNVPEGADLTAPLWTLYTAPRTYNFLPYLDANGTQRVFRASRNNPYWNLDNIYNNGKNSRVIPVFTLNYHPLKWLTVTERFGIDSYSDQNDYYEAPSTILLTTGVVRQNSAVFRQINHDLIVEGNRTFGDFAVNLLLGNNIKTIYNQSHNLTGTGTSILGYDNVANGSVLTGSQSYSEVRKIGFYAQSNIGYKNYLNLSLTGRYDASSVLSLDNYMYPYGSASVGFLFGELLKIPAINFGKLRVSYSSVGNDNVGAYANNTVFSQAGSFPYNGQSGFLQSSTLGNPYLKNESTNEAEIGLEMNFLKNRLSFEVSYFDRHHNDLLTSINLAPATGFSSTSANIGDMTNKGIEAVLNITPVKTKKFNWDISFNYTKIKNVVTKLNGVSTLQSIGQTALIVGQPYGVIYNIGYQRNANGDILIDNNGLPLATTNNIAIGNIQPKYQAGMTNNFRYGSFSMGFFLDFKNGGQVLNSDDRYGFFYGTPKVTENREDRVVEGIVASTGLPNTRVVKAQDYYQRLNVIYEAAVQDATFLKLRYANIGYNLPQTVLRKTPFSAASFTVTGRNLFIYSPHFTGSDPEVSSLGTSNGAQGTYGNSVPSSRSFNFTLNLIFK